MAGRQKGKIDTRRDLINWCRNFNSGVCSLNTDLFSCSKTSGHQKVVKKFRLRRRTTQIHFFKIFSGIGRRPPYPLAEFSANSNLILKLMRPLNQPLKFRIKITGDHRNFPPGGFTTTLKETVVKWSFLQIAINWECCFFLKYDISIIKKVLQTVYCL